MKTVKNIDDFLSIKVSDISQVYEGRYTATSYMVNPRSEVDNSMVHMILSEAKKRAPNSKSIVYGDTYTEIGIGFGKCITIYYSEVKPKFKIDGLRGRSAELYYDGSLIGLIRSCEDATDAIEQAAFDATGNKCKIATYKEFTPASEKECIELIMTENRLEEDGNLTPVESKIFMELTWGYPGVKTNCREMKPKSKIDAPHGCAAALYYDGGLIGIVRSCEDATEAIEQAAFDATGNECKISTYKEFTPASETECIELTMIENELEEDGSLTPVESQIFIELTWVTVW